MLHSEDKSSLRKIMRHQRRQLTQAQQFRHSKNVCKLALAAPQLQSSRKKIAVYNAFDGELNLDPLSVQLALRGYELYSPSVSLEKMLFVRKMPLSSSSKSASGLNFTETDGFCRTIAPQQLDIIFMPLVAADKTGHRLGMGGGYYDKTLSFKRFAPAKRPLLIGVAHEQQITKTLKHNKWDISLNALITERHFYHFC